MGARSDKRAERKAKKLAQFEDSKPGIVARVGDLTQPRQHLQVVENSAPRIAPHLVRQAAQDNIPKAYFDGSRFGMNMTYCITKKDHDQQWSWLEPRAWTDQEWTEEIQPPMQHLSSLTWAAIDRLASGSGHKMHHSHEITQLVEEAQRRWLELGLEEWDSVFRFRMGGTKRAWGYVVQAHFHMVWWERHHRIYPV